MSDHQSGGGVSIIVRNGDYESAHYALALASAALAVNKPAVLFFTMGGLRALTGLPPGLDEWGRDAINKERGVGDFETLLQACVELGAKFIVCEMGLRSLGIAREQLRGDVPFTIAGDRKSTRLNSSHTDIYRMPSSA